MQTLLTGHKGSWVKVPYGTTPQPSLRFYLSGKKIRESILLIVVFTPLGANIMILVFALAGTFTATIAGVTALIMGQSWWIGLASYIGAGMLTVGILAVFTAFALKGSPRKANAPQMRAGMPLAEN